MAQQVTLKAGGLFLNPDPLAEVPPGAMEDAKNVVIDRPGLVAPRERFGEVTQPASINGDESVYVVPWDGDRFTVSRDGSSTKLYNWTEDQEVTDEAAASLAFTVGEFDHFEAAGALFFTEGGGIRKLADSADTTAGLAGVPRPPIPQPGQAGETAGFLAEDDLVAYRVAFGRWDGDRKIVGPPSDRAILAFSHPTTTSDDVDITITIPDGVRAGDFVEVYRTETITPAALTQGAEEPSDVCQMRASLQIDASHISAGEIIWRDDDSDYQGAYLYTNETQQGALAANFRPYPATCTKWFNSMAFYGGVTTEPRLIIKISAWKYGGVGADWQWPRPQASMGTTSSCTLGSPTITITGIKEHVLRVGQYIGGSADTNPLVAGTFPASTTITAIDVGAGSVTVSANALANDTSLKVWDWIDVDGQRYIPHTGSFLPGGYEDRFFWAAKTAAIGSGNNHIQGARDLCRAINEDASSDYYATCAGYGKGEHAITFWPKALTGSGATVTSTGGDFFDKPVDETTGVAMEADGGPHRLAWSKLDQPEAVPVTHFQDIGAEGKAILALARTRDSLFVFKEDGTWKLTGETPESLRIDEFDLTLRLVHPDAVCEFGGQVIAWTTRGVVAVSEGGVTELSAQLDQAHLEDRSNDVLSAANPRQTEFVFMFGDEQSKRLYMALANGGGSDDIVYVLSTRTGAWTRWDFHDSDGVHDGAFDETTGQALFGTDGGECLREEDLSAYGYDDSLPFGAITITGDTVAILPGSGWTPEVGDIVAGSDWLARVTVVNTATNFDIEAISGTPATGTLTGHSCFDAVVKWAPQAAGAPAYSKHWRDLVMVYQRCANHPPVKVEFDADGVDGSSSIEVGEYSDTSAPRYFRGSVSRNAARCTRLGVQATFHGLTRWLLSGISLTFEPESERL